MMSVIRILILTALFAPSLAWSHARLLKPAPRSNADNLKAGPCGNVARTAAPTTFTVGEEIDVEWEETINHPGYYVLGWSTANDQNFQPLPGGAMVLDQGAPQKYTMKIKLPDQPCDACTFRLVQMMTENPNNPSPYFSCADVRLVAVNSNPQDPPGSGSADNSSQSATSQPKGLPAMGGCGRIDAGSGDGNSSSALLTLLIFAIPALAALRLKRPDSRAVRPQSV